MNFANFVIYQGKVREKMSCHLLGCEISKNEMPVLSINPFINKSYLRVATGWSGKVYYKDQGKPGKVMEFQSEK